MSTVPNNRNDIVLIDSESERENSGTILTGYDAPPRKKFKISSNGEARTNVVKAFMNSSSDSEVGDGNGSQSSTKSTSDLGSDNSLSANISGAYSLAGVGDTGAKLESSSALVASELVSTSSGSNSSDLDAISECDSTEEKGENKENYEVTRKVISETRKYLKDHGTMEFLDKYLPTIASSLDLLRLIKKLGFYPRDIPVFNDGDRLIGLIKLLHSAMKKVNSMRTRLENFYNVDHVLEKIKNAEKILVVTGAGISTSLGIPDFRSSKGFYAKLEHLGLTDPQEVFDLDFFHSDPSIFYLIAHMILPPENSYTPLHAFIKLLQSKGKLLRNYTQNIDNLESNVGIKPENLIQCHGSFATASCVTCKYQVQGEKIYPQIRAQEIPYCPKCSKSRKVLLNKDAYVPESYGVMKPDITFFGEPLPAKFHSTIRQDLVECDLLISIGTSLKVSPVADIVERIPQGIPQVLINRDPIDHCNFDVSILGYCDDTASYLCSRLGDGWNIEHPDFQRIVGDNGDNLKLITINEHEGHYSLINQQTEAELTLNGQPDINGNGIE